MARIFHQIANIFGYQLKRKTKLYNAQNTIKSLIDLQQVDLVIDVGANIGQFASELRSTGYTGEIISFEPVVSTYLQLVENSKTDPLWKPINIGLGSKNEEISINTSSFSVFDSILKLNDFAVKNWESLEVESTELIRISTLDQFVFENKLQDRRIFLKLDTQGYDLEAFRGASNSIHLIKAMQSEVSFVQIYEGMPNFRESLDTYLASGFQISAFFPISQQPNGASIEMDCLLVKPD